MHARQLGCGGSLREPRLRERRFLPGQLRFNSGELPLRRLEPMLRRHLRRARAFSVCGGVAPDSDEEQGRQHGAEQKGRNHENELRLQRRRRARTGEPAADGATAARCNLRYLGDLHTPRFGGEARSPAAR